MSRARVLAGPAPATAVLLAASAAAGWGYRANEVVAFWGGLLLAALALFWLAFGASGHVVRGLIIPANVLVLAVLALALCDLWLAVNGGDAPDPRAGPVLSYREGWAPEQIRLWRQRTAGAWLQALGVAGPGGSRLMQRDPEGFYPLRLIPNTRLHLFDSEYRINSLGLRGDEVASGDVIRLIAIGESTTLGLTLRPDDRPWPEVLEDRLSAELVCDRPIEVLNAGVAAWNLEHSLRRLEDELLPLRPDMVISYHGHNGYGFILPELPPVAVRNPPVLQPRPSPSLARVEFALDVLAFRRGQRDWNDYHLEMTHDELLNTKQAKLYRELIELGRREGFTVVLGTFNLAVNASSPPEVVEFYTLTSPVAPALIQANVLHNELVMELGRGDGVIAVDTTPGLDGHYDEHFIDLAHFTQSGRDLLAERFASAIVPALLEGRFGCRRR